MNEMNETVKNPSWNELNSVQKRFALQLFAFVFLIFFVIFYCIAGTPGMEDFLTKVNLIIKNPACFGQVTISPLSSMAALAFAFIGSALLVYSTWFYFFPKR